MAEEKLLTVRDVSLVLGISEKEVMNLAESGKIPAYKVGGVYLRFQRQQVEVFRKALKPSAAREDSLPHKYSVMDRIGDFFYFNDFYILSGILILLILFIIYRGY